VRRSLAPANPVALNLFQGPSSRKLGARRSDAVRAGLLANPRFGRGAKWTLKRVQGDEVIQSDEVIQADEVVQDGEVMGRGLPRSGVELVR